MNGISTEHQELHRVSRRFLQTHCPSSVPRATLDAGEPSLPPFWPELADMGWLGLHVPKRYGGHGYGLAELSVVLEELGRAVAPGPFLPTVLASALLLEGGDDQLLAEHLPGLVDGSARATVAFCAGALSATTDAEGRLRAQGTLRPVLGAALADTVLVPVLHDHVEAWYAMPSTALALESLPSLDGTRELAAVTATDVELESAWEVGRLDRSTVSDLAALLLAAESVGGAGWCLDAAVDHAKVREQFGGPIGRFQAVKHRCVDMALNVEKARAAVWDAAGAATQRAEGQRVAIAVAAALALDACLEAAKGCIQVHGGIGFTWEHDTHLYLKRAATTSLLLAGARSWRRQAAALAIDGARRTPELELPSEAASHQAATRGFLASLADLDEDAQRTRIIAEGYAVPHWPRPWGRAADAVEQLVIDEEFRRADRPRPHPGMGGFVVPAIIAHGTLEQQERWIAPTLYGAIRWCQLFSEPGAGSDLASLSTKATAVPGGWRLTGQKVWTSFAHESDWGICLARTNPHAPKHEGITCFLLDMRTEGIEVRPLRELTGDALFNEVFLTDVFVPDDCVLGEVDNGWAVGRTTLANERVSMSSGSPFGASVEGLLGPVAERQERSVDTALLEELGRYVADAQAIALLGLRATIRAVSSIEPGPESSLRKLLNVEHDQRVQEFGLSLLGPAGAVLEENGSWARGFLSSRCLTIAGGTSEIQRNVIAERVLGLPRD